MCGCSGALTIRIEEVKLLEEQQRCFGKGMTTEAWSDTQCERQSDRPTFLETGRKGVQRPVGGRLLPGWSSRCPRQGGSMCFACQSLRVQACNLPKSVAISFCWSNRAKNTQFCVEASMTGMLVAARGRVRKRENGMVCAHSHTPGIKDLSTQNSLAVARRERSQSGNGQMVWDRWRVGTCESAKVGIICCHQLLFLA